MHRSAYRLAANKWIKLWWWHQNERMNAGMLRALTVWHDSNSFTQSITSNHSSLTISWHLDNIKKTANLIVYNFLLFSIKALDLPVTPDEVRNRACFQITHRIMLPCVFLKKSKFVWQSSQVSYIFREGGERLSISKSGSVKTRQANIPVHTPGASVMWIRQGAIIIFRTI